MLSPDRQRGGGMLSLDCQRGGCCRSIAADWQRGAHQSAAAHRLGNTALRYTSSYCLLNEHIPLLEVSIEDSAGEALSADSDAFQYTVTPQLVDNQEVLHQTCEKLAFWLLIPTKPTKTNGELKEVIPGVFDLIGNQATHKVGMGAPQVGHKLAQVFL